MGQRRPHPFSRQASCDGTGKCGGVRRAFLGLAGVLLLAGAARAELPGTSHVGGVREPAPALKSRVSINTLHTDPPGAAVYLPAYYQQQGTSAPILGVADGQTFLLPPGVEQQSVLLHKEGYEDRIVDLPGAAAGVLALTPATPGAWIGAQFRRHPGLAWPATLALLGAVGLAAWKLYELGRRRAGTRDVVHLTLVGRTFDGYHLVEHLGAGAFSNVYKAQILATGEFVAMKVLKSDFLNAEASEALRRFHRETRVPPNHKKVVQVQAVGGSQGCPYRGRELVSGQTLRGLLEPALSPGAALGIFVQMCRGVGHAHSRGYVHRDLKPENVMVRDDGVVKVMDFGIAKHLEMPGVTRTALTMGTPRYMAPEQVDSRRVDARSDIYSMGIMLFEMLTGRTPFDGELMELITAHMFEAPPHLDDLDPGLPGALDPIVQRMLAKEPSERYQTVDELIEAVSVCCRALEVPLPV